jgi:Lamin Tail Domain
MKKTTTGLSIALCCLLIAGCNSSKKDHSARYAAINSGTTGGSTSGGTGGTTSGSGAAALDLVQSSVPFSEAQIGPDVVGLALSLASSGSGPVELASITVKASGSIDESTALGEVKLIGDDNGNGAFDVGEPTLATVAGPAFTVNDGSLTLSPANPITLAPGANLNLLVSVEVTAIGQTALGLLGESVQLSVDAAGDIAVSASGQPVTPGGQFPSSAGAVNLYVNDHLLITEITPVNPNFGIEEDFIELYNPTLNPIDLSQVYINDASDSTGANVYWNLPTGANFIDPFTTADFITRFPAGATLAPGATVVVAIDGAGFQTIYGQAADYCIVAPTAQTPQMDSWNGSAFLADPTRTFADLYDTGEIVNVFRWDGQSDLVEDLDYVFHGTVSSFNTHLDKSGAAVDGPDADTTPSVYAAELPAAMRTSVVPGTATDIAVQRVDYFETGQTQTGGNGITGRDEGSEPVDVTFMRAVPTPGTP